MWWAALAGQGMQQAGKLDDTLTGLALQKPIDKRQVKQQTKLQELAIKGQKELADYNQQLALDMWDKTNYSAQKEQLKKAGMNPGLMYGGTGAGGTTSGAGSASGVSTGSALPMAEKSGGMGMQLGMQMAQAKANIDLTNAQTEKTKVETTKTGGVDTQEAQGRIAKLAQETENAAVQKEIMEYDAEVKNATREENIKNTELVNNQLQAATTKIVKETVSAEAKGKIDRETANDIIRQIKTNTIEQSLRMELTRHQIITQAAVTQETYNKIEKISEEIVRMQEQTRQGYKGLSQDQQKIILNQIETEFGTGKSAEILRWLNGIVGAARAVK